MALQWFFWKKETEVSQDESVDDAIIAKLQLMAGSEPLWQELVHPAIDRWSAWTQGLSSSPSGVFSEPGGLTREGLLVAEAIGGLAAEGASLGTHSRASMLAARRCAALPCAFAAMMPALDAQLLMQDGSAVWNPLAEPAARYRARHPRCAVRFEDAAGRRSPAGRGFALALAVCGAPYWAYLGSEEGVLEDLAAALLGDARSHLARLAAQAHADVLARERRRAGSALAQRTEMRALASLVAIACADLLSSGAWDLREGPLLYTQTGSWLLWPEARDALARALPRCAEIPASDEAFAQLLADCGFALASPQGNALWSVQPAHARRPHLALALRDDSWIAGSLDSVPAALEPFGPVAARIRCAQPRETLSLQAQLPPGADGSIAPVLEAVLAAACAGGSGAALHSGGLYVPASVLSAVGQETAGLLADAGALAPTADGELTWERNGILGVVIPAAWWREAPAVKAPAGRKASKKKPAPENSAGEPGPQA